MIDNEKEMKYKIIILQLQNFINLSFIISRVYI